MSTGVPTTARNGKLRAVVVEDLRSDVELMLDQLVQEGYAPECTFVTTEREFVAAIATRPDVVLCDWRLPQFSGERALALRQQLDPDLPFVIVSGRIGEEVAVDAMHRGADDYVLKDRISRLGPAVRRAIAYRRELRERRRAETADRAKSVFLASMSHDLRTPLNAIIGFSSLLLTDAAGDLTAEQRKQLEIIRGSGHQLLALITDLLDISRIEAGGLDLHPAALRLSDILGEQCEAVKLQIAERRLELDGPACDASMMVLADAARLRQVIGNLLANAIKFTDHGRIRVAAEAAQGMARIVIEDTGIGIPGDDQDRVFDLFHRGSGRGDTSREGTGLGLAICKQLVDAMGGTIGVESNPGSGSRFWFTIPLAIAG